MGIDLRADEGSPSRETGFRSACRTAERPRQKQAGQAPSGNRGAARQRVHSEVHREALQIFACQPPKLTEETRNQETEAVKSCGVFGTFEPLGPIKPEAGPKPTGWTAPEPKLQKRSESGAGRYFAQNPGTGRRRIRVKTGHKKIPNGNCEGMIVCLRWITISSRPNRRTQGLESLSTGFGTPNPMQGPLWPPMGL